VFLGFLPVGCAEFNQITSDASRDFSNSYGLQRFGFLEIISSTKRCRRVRGGTYNDIYIAEICKDGENNMNHLIYTLLVISVGGPSRPAFGNCMHTLLTRREPVRGRRLE
jgi:hypothetical protein